MLNLPKSTEVGRIVSKERFYEKESSKIKEYFVNNIDRIIWTNKISPTTLNINSKTYLELQVFEIHFKSVNTKTNDIIRLIDSKVPYLILFLAICKNEIKAIISFKQIKEKKNLVVEQFESKWQDFENFKLELKGNSVDTIYENYLYQIEASLRFGGNLKENVDKYKQIKSLKAEIEKINRKIKNEPAIAKRQELARERNVLEIQLIDN